jgi:hypothetical protein
MTFIPDSDIQDIELLYRAIHPSFWNEEENRPSSALFKDEKGVSVDRDGERNQKDIILFLLSDRSGYGAGNLNAGETRKIGTFLKSSKIPNNNYHALIFESETKIKLSNSKAKSLSRTINILLPPVTSNL